MTSARPEYSPTAHFVIALLVHDSDVLTAYRDSGLPQVFNALFEGPTFTVDKKDSTLYYTPSRAGAKDRPAGATLKGACLFYAGKDTLVFALNRQSELRDGHQIVTLQVEQFDTKLAHRQKGVQVISFEETRPSPNHGTETVTACTMKHGLGMYSGLSSLKILNQILSQKPLNASPFGPMRLTY